MFCHIAQNWRGKPLISHEVIVNLIANTATKAGLEIPAALESARYPTGVPIADDQFAPVHSKRSVFHDDWNYAIYPVWKRS